MHRKLIISFSAIIAVVGFSAIAWVICRGTGIETASAMKHSLDAQIPIGTTVSDAEGRLKASGFAVSHETNASWGNQTHLEYLYGDMMESGLVSIVKRRWQVAVFLRAGVVTGIDVKLGLIGP